MNPPLRYSIPSSLKPMLTNQQYNCLMESHEHGPVLWILRKTVCRNLEQKGLGSIKGLKFTINQKGIDSLKA